MPLQFKPLEIKRETNFWKRIAKSKQVQKTVLYMLGGALLSFGFSYFSEGMSLREMQTNDIMHSVFMGAFLGFFITNSPCARGKC